MCVLISCVCPVHVCVCRMHCIKMKVNFLCNESVIVAWYNNSNCYYSYPLRVMCRVVPQ